MAAAVVIPAVAALISGIAPQFPAMVQFVEGLFGHSTTTSAPTGPEKLQTAVNLLQQALVALANAGKVPSAGVVDPSLIPALTGAVQATVDALKASGVLPPSTTAVGAATTQLAKPVATLKGGQTVTITVT